GEQRGRGAERHGGQRRRGGRVLGHGRRQQRPAGEQPYLDRPSGPQVEQVGQVGRARDGGAVDQRVGGAARDERGGAQPGRADAEDLDGAAGDLAPGERAQVAFEAFGGGGAVEVVVGAERAAARPGQQRRRPHAAGQAGRQRRRGARPGDERGPFEQRDRL